MIRISKICISNLKPLIKAVVAEDNNFTLIDTHFHDLHDSILNPLIKAVVAKDNNFNLTDTHFHDMHL